ncbi:MAG: PAS-domain containing protein [Bacteroidota bacterium]
MAKLSWQRLGQAIAAFRQSLSGRCANTDCMGSDRLARLLSAAPVVLYVLRWPDMIPTFVSDNIVRFTGLEPELPTPHPTRWERYIHPDDRERCHRALATVAEHGRMSLDHRLRHAEGGWRWVRNEARVVLDDKGMPIEVVGSMLDISERHAFEEALSASETQLRAAQNLLTDALESSGDAFSLYDAEDRLLVFNSRYKEFYETIADDIRPGVPFEQLLHLSARRGQYMGIAPEQADEWVRERMAHHAAAASVFEQQLANGRYLEIVERPTTGGGRVAIRRDVTARKRIEDALRSELTFEQTLIDALPFPVYFKGCDGRFLGCNTKFAEALGRPILAIIGRTLYDLLPAERAAEFTATDLDLFAHAGVQTREITMQWGDGSIRRLNIVKGTFCDSKGDVAGYIGSLIDITSQKRAEEQLVQAAKLATLGQIASEVAHELNQPLSIIRMSAETCLQIRDGDDRDRLERKLSTIVGQVRRMAEIVDHLRSFSRLESGDKRPFSPAPVVASAIRLLSPHFQLDDIALVTDIDPACPDIFGQPTQMEQVLLNLLSNARDAVRDHRPGGAGQVEIRLWASDDTISLSVHDNGGGIADAVWPQVFEPFFTTKGDGTGTGLGLSISSNIIAGMGGRISGCNIGDGARFLISLPAYHRTAEADEAAEPSAPPPCEPAPPGILARGRVLVVDDEDLAVECIAEFLEARGFDVATATAPDQALSMARQNPPDLLITDLRLPGLSGISLWETLCRDHPELPAILMTGGPLPSPPLPSHAVTLGKPLALNELLRHADRLMRERVPACP